MDKLRRKLYTVIFEAETPAGRAFDVVLLILIFVSVLTVVLESVVSLRRNFYDQFIFIEWVFTILFTIEYLLRIYSSPRPVKYIFSFFGLVDLLAILPTYMSIFILGSQYFLVVRALRLLRVARILKLTTFIDEGQVLSNALRASFHKIVVFMGTVLTLVVIVGSVMYVIEGAASGFTSIPTSIYWAIVTITTVGYGDISPATPVGQFLASFLMITGYGIIAVPTGIVTVELSQADRRRITTRVCPNCQKEGHALDANYCSNCGFPLNKSPEAAIQS
ncbi:ion transporter [Botryobacter ruber]|uniref:ion transporter n=1 Tax=Botryobacter ruber TaxID=2171629 RepID=UPI000E0AB38A|nr:ion transporter [Botryobacter ruber]